MSLTKICPVCGGKFTGLLATKWESHKDCEYEIALRDARDLAWDEAVEVCANRLYELADIEAKRSEGVFYGDPGGPGCDGKLSDAADELLNLKREAK